MRTSRWPVFLLRGIKRTSHYVTLLNSKKEDEGSDVGFLPQTHGDPRELRQAGNLEIFLRLKVSGLQLAFLIFRLRRPLCGS